MRAVVLALSLLAAPAFAQAPGATPPIGGPSQQPSPLQIRANKIKQQIRNRRQFEVTEALELDEKTAGRILAVFGRYDEQFDKLLAARAELQGKLNGADQIRDSKVLEKLIDEAVANQRALWDLEEHRLAELRTILTPQQTAKLIVVLPQLERRLQNQLQKAINKANNARPRQRGRRPFDGDDDDD